MRKKRIQAYNHVLGAQLKVAGTHFHNNAVRRLA
jgi:hypothetical protein